VVNFCILGFIYHVVKKHLPFLFLLCVIACQQNEPTASPTAGPQVWQATRLSFQDDRFLMSAADEDAMYLLFQHQLVSVNNKLEVTKIIDFDGVADNPYPVVENGLLVAAQVAGDSWSLSIVDIKDDIEPLTLDLKKMVKDIGVNKGIPFFIDIAAINSEGKILIVLPDFETHNYVAVIYDIDRSGAKIELKNQLVREITEIETLDLRTITAVGKNFFLSSWYKTYRMDGNGNVFLHDSQSMIGKPFYFENKWHMKTYNGFYASSDDGETWQDAGLYNYTFVYPMGMCNEKLFFLDNVDVYCKPVIKWTNDLNDIHDFTIRSELTSDGCYVRLQVLDNYLYSLEKGVVHRLRL